MLIEGLTPRCGDTGYRRPNLGATQTTGPIAGDTSSSWIPASGYRSVQTAVVGAGDAPGAPGIMTPLIPVAIDPSGAFLYAPQSEAGLLPADVQPFVGEGGPTSSLAPPAKAAAAGGIPWLPLAIAAAGVLLFGG